MADSSGSCMDSEGRAQEDSEKKNSVEIWSRDHLRYVLAEKLSSFWTCPETFCEADLNRNELLNLVEEMFRQHSIHGVA